MKQKLQDKIRNEYGEKGLRELEIPSHIRENLKNELREYQIKALKYYLANNEIFKQNHLLFNMATGSGKTLIMAALMLDCYKRGYRNFVFFVNSTAILEKTKANFCDSKSDKYLFSNKIVIDSSVVEINAINNLLDSRRDCINIIFSTIHKLFYELKEEREDRITLEDFKERRIVFLADEAHHLNANTKSKRELEEKENWESMIIKAFEANKQNLMLEFSATIPKVASVQEKYIDKLIYEYALKEFHNDGFSKRIYLLQYRAMEIEARFLGSVILSIYRYLLAKSVGVYLKSVILYKSRYVASSKENEEKFINFIEKLDSKRVEEFLRDYTKSDDDKNIFYEAREFFKEKNYSYEKICEMIRSEFSKEHIINVNDDKDLEKQQLLLNSLESKDNDIRAIFAVDKLNEGWDVLNLFDIVRLYEGAIKDTTKEAQLIGRGARYYPFTLDSNNEMKYKRKFDSTISPLRALESLSYHAASENEFIKKLNDELISIGLKESKKKITLKLKEEIKQSEFFKQAYFATNSRYKVGRNLFNQKNIEMIKSRANELKIPLFHAKGAKESDMMSEDIKDLESGYKEAKFSDIEHRIILKAMNKFRDAYTFDTIKNRFKLESRSEFIKEILGSLSIKLHSRQKLDSASTKLNIALFVLEKLKDSITKELDSYEVGSYEAKELREALGDKDIFRDENVSSEDYKKYPWYVFDKFIGTPLEREFLEFIKSREEEINSYFSHWLIIRNERFAEFVIYDDREFLDGERNPTYAERFEPDFYFLGKRVGDERIITQCIIEPKGEGYIANDKWKEEFLLSIFNKDIKHKDIRVNVNGLPFFKESSNDNFKDKFNKIINIDKTC